MKHIMIKAMTLVCLCLFLFACDHHHNVRPDFVYGYFLLDLSTNAVVSDWDTSVVWRGIRPYWLDSDNVFYAEGKIFHRTPGQNIYQQLVADSLDCSSTKKLSFSLDRSTMYFSANGDIYSCGLNGDALINHTAADISYYINPHLSADGNYITAISTITGSKGRIAMLDLNSGVISTVDNIETAIEAFYYPAANLLIYVASEGYYYKLFRALGDGTQSRTILDENLYDHYLDASFDGRFYTLSFSISLYVYDAVDDVLTDMGRSLGNTLAWNSNTLYYGDYNAEYPRLMSYNMQSAQKNIVYDRQFNGFKMTNFSGLVLRGDDGFINFRGHYDKNSKEGGRNEITF